MQFRTLLAGATALALSSGVASAQTANGVRVGGDQSAPLAQDPATKRLIEANSDAIADSASDAAAAIGIQEAQTTAAIKALANASSSAGLTCTVVSGDQAWTIGSSQGLTCTNTGRLKVGLSSAATIGQTASTTPDLAGMIDTNGNQAGLHGDAYGNLRTVGANDGAAAANVTPLTGASGVLGWLSSIYNALIGTLKVSGAVTVTGSVSGGEAVGSAATGNGVRNTGVNGAGVATDIGVTTNGALIAPSVTCPSATCVLTHATPAASTSSTLCPAQTNVVLSEEIFSTAAAGIGLGGQTLTTQTPGSAATTPEIPLVANQFYTLPVAQQNAITVYTTATGAELTCIQKLRP